MAPTAQQVSQYMQGRFLSRPAAAIGLLFCGALISFGISCILLLSANPEMKASKQHRLLRAYTVAVVLTVIMHNLCVFLWLNAVEIFDPDWSSQDRLADASLITYLLYTITPLFVAILTDGLLVSLTGF
jgi:hypothetical protein